MKFEAEQMEKVLTQALISPDKAPQLIGKALEMLRAARAEETAEREEKAKSTRNKPTTYQVNEHGGEEVLEEYRPEDPYPFRCSRSYHDALVEVLAGQEEPLQFKDLMAAATEKMGSEPADYLLRICLRFWLRADPPLVKKLRARYVATDPRQFRKHASILWNKLAEK